MAAVPERPGAAEEISGRPSCHGRACPGHPRGSAHRTFPDAKPLPLVEQIVGLSLRWMAGTSPARMTKVQGAIDQDAEQQQPT